MQLPRRVRDGEDNLGKSEGQQLGFSELQPGWGCSEQHRQDRRREQAAPPSLSIAPGLLLWSCCGFCHNQLPFHPSPAPRTPYLHKGVEAGVPQALPVRCRLKAQLVGAGPGLSRSQEGLAAPVLIGPPASRIKFCRGGCPSPAVLAVPRAQAGQPLPAAPWLWGDRQQHPLPRGSPRLSYLCTTSVHCPGSCSWARWMASPAAGSPVAVFST